MLLESVVQTDTITSWLYFRKKNYWTHISTSMGMLYRYMVWLYNINTTSIITVGESRIVRNLLFKIFTRFCIHIYKLYILKITYATFSPFNTKNVTTKNYQSLRWHQELYNSINLYLIKCYLANFLLEKIRIFFLSSRELETSHKSI
jgi:hypothetical protein